MDALAMLVPAAYLAVLGVLSLFGVHRLVVLALYRRHRHDRPHAPVLEGALPRVTVQLPVFNERAVVERMIDAACRLDWPAERLQIQVLDDSTDDTVALSRAAAARWAERGVDISVAHRVDRTGFKAGALEAGLASATGELIAIFDADFIPPPGFLRRLVPYFGAGPDVGMVQARWGHLNEQLNLLTKLSALLLDGHFVLEHTARNRSGRFFNFNGTAGVWRRRCIDDAGGWQHDTLVEDLDLSYRAQLKGWRFTFLKDEVCPAELPADVRAFKTQQHRWAKGTLQAARKLLPTVLRAPVGLGVKLEAMAHMLANLAYPLVLVLAVLMPPAVFLRGRTGVAELVLLDIPAFVLATLSVALFYAASQHEAHGRWLDKAWRLPFLMSLGIGMAVNQSRAVFEGLFGSDVTFVRTPKVGEGAPRARGYRPAAGWTPFIELALCAYLLAGGVLVAWQGWYGSLPFLGLFAFGFGYVGVGSLRPAPRPRAQDAADEPEVEPSLSAAR
jgi:cellulose synthase/poly-beta-1,6-N-acetylglucosamine synthase-like glycosyltransferase